MERVEKEGWMTYCRSDRGQRWFGSRGASPPAIFLEDILLSGLGSGWSACMESRYRLFGVVRWAGVRLDPRSVFGDRLTVQFCKDIYIYVFIRSSIFSLYLIYLDYSSLVFVNLFFLFCYVSNFTFSFVSLLIRNNWYDLLTLLDARNIPAPLINQPCRVKRL